MNAPASPASALFLVIRGPSGHGASDAHIVPCDSGWSLWRRGIEPSRPPHSITEGGASGRPCILRAPVGTDIPSGFTQIFRDVGELSGSDVWALSAPLSLTEYAADEAGVLGLSSEHAYVVVREIPEGGRWTVGLGIGGHMRHLRGSHLSPEEARAVGVATCKERTQARIEEIRAARGGTLAWGLEVPEVAPEPKVLFPARGETAWDLLKQERAAKTGN